MICLRLIDRSPIRHTFYIVLLYILGLPYSRIFSLWILMRKKNVFWEHRRINGLFLIINFIAINNLFNGDLRSRFGLRCKDTRGRRINSQKTNGATLGFEAALWATADKLRNNMDAAEYKHDVLGLIFLKFISDAIEERHAQLQKEMDQGCRSGRSRWVSGGQYLLGALRSPVESVQAQAPQPKFLANQVLRKISGVRELYNRLILVVESARNGKTEALQEVQTAWIRWRQKNKRSNKV